MTSKQRVLAAAEHRVADRTPLTFDAQKEVYETLFQHFGVTRKEDLFDRLHCDTWMLIPRNYTVPEGATGPERTAIWGYRTRTVAYSGGTYDEVCLNPLAGKDDLADIRRHPWPTPDTQDFSRFRAAAAAHADRAVIGTFTHGPYFIASFVRGLEDLMVDFAIHPDYADHLVGTIADISLEVLRRMLAAGGDGVDIVYMADDYCSQLGPLFSPDAFRRFVVPYLTRFAAEAHRHRKKFLLHVCGAVRPLLPLIVDAGVDMLEPIQVRAAGMDPVELKREFGRDLCFYGGVDLQQVLSRGTPREVADEVKRLIDILGEGGGYILGPGHTYIQPDSPLENILAMYETAVAYRPRG